MSARGRATLATLGFLPLAAAVWAAGSQQPPAGELPPVSSRPQESVPAEASRPAQAAATADAAFDTAPLRLLARLPVTRDALTLGNTAELEPGEKDDGYAPGLLYEWVYERERPPLRVEYTLDAELMARVFRTLRRARVGLGHVLLLDPSSGRVLAYASTDAERFPPTRAYPAASLVKVVTAAAALDVAPDTARLPCRYNGSPWRLSASRLDPPSRGREISLRRALATSNNQCFAQLAVHALGEDALLDAIARFGWLAEPGPAHEAGSVDPGEDRMGLGRLGCGLSGCRITPLHAAQLAATLARGELVPPRWIHRVVDAQGRELRLPAPPPRRQVMTPELASELRAMLVDTTRSGTARRAFRRRDGRAMLGSVQVAGKTGSLTGRQPDGRYEWFIGAAPAGRPNVVVAVLLVQGNLWWRNASQIAAETLEHVFCEKGFCEDTLAERWLRPRGRPAPSGTQLAAALDSADRFGSQ